MQMIRPLLGLAPPHTPQLLLRIVALARSLYFDGAAELSGCAADHGLVERWTGRGASRKSQEPTLLKVTFPVVTVAGLWCEVREANGGLPYSEQSLRLHVDIQSHLTVD